MDKKTLIAEEAFVVKHSGEIPEVTLHESLYYLTRDADGPGLELDPRDILPLKQAVVERYRTIILRDLDPGNRDKGIYRGLARCVANWQRLTKYCLKENIDFRDIKAETAYGLRKFLVNELADVQSGRRSSCINCTSREIENLVSVLGMAGDDLPDGWQKLCQAS
ncbi:MAG: hypothetical protein JRF02_05610 [Deltaproteobacteria bacterium]|nr:hypothetical protein [Deltaproteobacteria bacterium]